MPIVAYLANQFPSPVEPYVAQEIQELRKCGVTIIPCSARRASSLNSDLSRLADETLYLQTLKLGLLIYAAFLCLAKFPSLKDFFGRATREAVARRSPHWAWSLLRTFDRRIERAAHPCASRIFRLVDRHGGRPRTGDRFQHDTAWIRSAHPRRLSRYKTGKL